MEEELQAMPYQDGKSLDHVYARPLHHRIILTIHERSMSARSPFRSSFHEDDEGLLTHEMASYRLRMRGPMRYAHCCYDSKQYFDRLRRAQDDMNYLARYISDRRVLRRYTIDHDGYGITLAWPVNKRLYVTSIRKLDHVSIVKNVRSKFLCDAAWVVPIGRITSDSATPYGEFDSPILMIDSKGRVLIYCYKSPDWSTCTRELPKCRVTRIRDDTLFLAAESLDVLATEGLVRCDWCYTPEGGAPYGVMQDDDAMYRLLNGGHDLVRVIAAKRCLRGRAWCITTMPGVEKDRFFRLDDGDIPSDIRMDIADRYRGSLTILGYIVSDLTETAYESDIVIVVNPICEVFAYIESESAVYWLAESIDSFFRKGTVRLYCNYEIEPNGSKNLWSVPLTRSSRLRLLRHHR